MKIYNQYREVISENLLLFKNKMEGNKKKKLSGYENRKRSAQKVKENAKQSGALLKYISKNTESVADHPSSSFTQNSPDIVNSMDVDAIDSAHVNENVICEKNVTLEYDYKDPGTWPIKCNNKVRDIIVQNWSQNIHDISYPSDSNNRKF